MKTSNKILVGLVLTIALILTAIHVGLYARYKKGEFYTMESLHEEAYEKHSISGVNKISVSGLQVFDIIPSDTLMLEIEKHNNNNNIVRFVQKGDSLVIAGDTAVRENDGSIQRLRSYQSVILHLPASFAVTIKNCDAHFKGAGDTAKAPSFDLNVFESSVTFGETRNSGTGISYFNKINMVAVNGNMVFFNDVVTKELSVSLRAAQLEDQGMDVNKITVDADNNSSVNLKGVNLKKLLPVTKQ